tara:strand:+ start:1332 stop:1562 length:231 start_codon:yes stop_codon:yes gene_type:complete
MQKHLNTYRIINMDDKKIEIDRSEISVDEIAKRAYIQMKSGTLNDVVDAALYAGCQAGVMEAIKTIYKIELNGEQN